MPSSSSGAGSPSSSLVVILNVDMLWLKSGKAEKTNLSYSARACTINFMYSFFYRKGENKWNAALLTIFSVNNEEKSLIQTIIFP